MIKRTLAAITAAVMLMSCSGGKTDPVAEALESYLVELAGEGASFQIYTLEKLDSTTFRIELERRKHVFEVKSRRESDLYVRYNSQGMRTNANLHMEALTKANRNIASMDSLCALMSGSMENIAYYDYRFTGKLSPKNAASEVLEAYFTITPDGEIISISKDIKDIHKGTGRAIPGYLDIFNYNDDEEDWILPTFFAN